MPLINSYKGISHLQPDLIMEENNNNLQKKLEKLSNKKKFEKIIALLTPEVLEKEKDKVEELYIWRGNARYSMKDYDGAMADYNLAIDINPDYELAFYNRGAVWVIKKEYNKAIADYTRVINIDADYAVAYVSRGNIIRTIKKQYDKAIAEYTKAIEIESNLAKAYYYRGLARKQKIEKRRNKVDLNEIKFYLNEIKIDFEKYLKLTTDEKDIGSKYAYDYIGELREQIKNPELWIIAKLVNDIKNILRINGKCVTHYTSLSVLESLIFDDSKFRISEGNFMNDPSEGKEFFKFLKYKPYTSRNNSSFIKTFSPKPFIGSFVTMDRYDNLDMWRFYGKEKGVEAKGCAITLSKQNFIDNIKDFLSNEKDKDARLDNESDINFYRVVYVSQNGPNKFYIHKLNKSKELENLMEKLKVKLEDFKSKVKESSALEKYLNRIAFLFKSDSYKNENEVRLVLKGIEFPKKYNMDVSSPRVYIELVSIKNIVSQITLGPKVDKLSEWLASFHYCYKEMIPKIEISHVPYK